MTTTHPPRLAADHRCPDCGARVTDKALEHEDSCPAALAEDAVSAADRAWFAAHPSAATYRRPITDAEAVALVIAVGLDPLLVTARGRVVVHQVAPGVRTRTYADLWLEHLP